MLDDQYNEAEARSREWRERMHRAYSEWCNSNNIGGGRKSCDFSSVEASDDYRIIGCSSRDSIDELRRAYRRAAKHYHPDTLHARASSDVEIRTANEMMMAVNAAWGRICVSRNIRKGCQK